MLKYSPLLRKIGLTLVIVPSALSSPMAFPSLTAVAARAPADIGLSSGAGAAGEAGALRLAPAEVEPYRIRQAKELMGGRYDQSVVKVGELVPDVREFVRKTARRSLRGQWQNHSGRIAQAIMLESQRNEFDPMFVMSVIGTESKWRPHARGSHGEIGLMQIKPSAARWIAGMYGIPYKGRKSLRDPAINIRIGTAYLAFLREQFDSKGPLYVSAYNAGLGTVQRALRHRATPSQEYMGRILHQYTQYYSTLRAERILADEV